MSYVQHPSSTLFPNISPPLPTLPWPVWRHSTTQDVRFQPMKKRDAVKIFHKARAWERSTRQFNKQDGILGRNGIAVLHALIFDFLNYTSGVLLPSQAAIAEKANISLSSVQRGLKKLKAAGVLNWIRRCVGEIINGHFTLKQETNAYAVLPSTQWCGFKDTSPLEAPPNPEFWGQHPPQPSAIDACVSVAARGGSMAERIRALESDSTDTLAQSLARLGRAILGKKP
jgi:hypothetical protein